MDNKDRIWNGTTTRHIQVIREQGDGFALERDYDLSKILRENERIVSVLPDWSGKIWFVARRDGVVGLLDPKTGKTNVIRLGNDVEGEIENSFAVGEDGAYVATNRKMLAPAHRPGPEAADRLAGRATRRSRASPSRASSTTAPARRRRSCPAATSRSPTTPTR